MALLLAASIPVLFGVPRRQIHVAWRDTGQRVALEQRFRLTESRLLSGNRWSYVPSDTRPEILRAIATDPAVESTDGIARDSYVLSNSPLTERRGGLMSPAPRRGAQVAKGAAYVSGAAGAMFVLLAVIAARRLTPHTVLTVALARSWTLAAQVGGVARLRGAGALALWRRRPPLGALWARAMAAAGYGIPEASAEAAGLFRIVFGGAVLIYVLSEPVSSSLLSLYDLPRAQGPYGSLMRWLTDHPALVDGLQSVMLPTGLLVVAGVATAVSYPAFVAAVLVWASIYALGTSHHVVSSLSMALVALLPARWGDGLSVDAWIRRRAGRGLSAVSSKRYGFAMWAPMFVCGVAFEAAAWSKLRQGPDWILNGTVKYHWVTDFDGALVPWGLQLSGYPVLAVFLSGAAVVVEVLLLTAAFSRSSSYRVVCGLSSLGLLVGFALFQGVVWPGWWLLLLGSLPWHRLRRVHAPELSRSLGIAQFAVVLIVLLLQVLASWARIEARPMVSAYDMYSKTYESPSAYEAASNLVYRVVGVTPSGSADLPDCTIDEPAARSFARAAEGDEGERRRIRSLIGECVDQRPDVVQVLIEGDKRVFDWESRRFGWKRALDRVGPVDATWIRSAVAR